MCIKKSPIRPTERIYWTRSDNIWYKTEYLQRLRDRAGMNQWASDGDLWARDGVSRIRIYAYYMGYSCTSGTYIILLLLLLWTRVRCTADDDDDDKLCIQLVFLWFIPHATDNIIMVILLFLIILRYREFIYYYYYYYYSRGRQTRIRGATTSKRNALVSQADAKRVQTSIVRSYTYFSCTYIIFYTGKNTHTYHGAYNSQNSVLYVDRFILYYTRAYVYYIFVCL